jgi:hypothetical protein
MRTKNLIILSVAIIIAALIGSFAYCFTNRYIINEHVIVDTWKKQVYPIEDVLKNRDRDIYNCVPIKPFDHK